jgi:hypothetical protein
MGTRRILELYELAKAEAARYPRRRFLYERLESDEGRLLYRDAEDAIGGLREDFLVEALGQAGVDFAYLKSTRGRKTPDYLIRGTADGLVIEVGGRGKGRRQFKGVDVARKVVLADAPAPKARRVPLFLAGFLA